MKFASPSYRKSSIISSENEDNAFGSEKKSTDPPKPRFSFFKFDISDGIPLKRTLMTNRGTVEDLLERESSFSQHRPQTGDSFFVRNNTIHSNTSRGIKEPYFYKFNQKKKTLANYEIYSALRTEKKKVHEEEGELPTLVDNTNRATSPTMNVPSGSFHFTLSESSLFAKTSAKSPIYSKVTTPSPRNLHLKTASVTPVAGKSRILFGSTTPTARAVKPLNTKKQQKTTKHKSLAMSVAQTDDPMDVKKLIQIADSESPRNNNKRSTQKKKGTAKPEGFEELTIDKVSENNFNRFKAQISLYNRYFNDYIAKPEMPFKTYNDLHVDLTKSSPEVVRKFEQVPLDPTSLDGLRKIKSMAASKRVALEFSQKKSASTEVHHDVVANSKLHRSHSIHIKEIDGEKDDLKDEFDRMSDVKLKPNELRFLEAVKSGNLGEVSLMISDNPELTKIRDGVRETPLHWACKRGYQAIVEVLLDYGADFQATDIVGRTPRVLAQRGGFNEIVKILTGYHEDFDLKSKLRGNLPAGILKKKF